MKRDDDKEMFELAKQLIVPVENFPIYGVSYKDISPLLLRTDILQNLMMYLMEDIDLHRKDIIIGIESRGFLVAGIMSFLYKNGITLVR